MKEESLEQRIEKLEKEFKEELQCVLASINYLNKMVSELNRKLDQLEDSDYDI